MKSGLLIAGAVPDDLLRLLKQDFELSILLNIDDLDAWLTEHAQGIEYAVTNGHDGFGFIANGKSAQFKTDHLLWRRI